MNTKENDEKNKSQLTKAQEKGIAPVPAPNVGDSVNFVVGESKHEIVPAKVLKVHDGHEGRLINLEAALSTGSKPVANVAWDPVEGKEPELHGNSWHWPAKAASILIALIYLLFGSASAQEFSSLSSTGTSSATVYFDARINKPLRLVNVDGTSDLSSSVFSWRVGTTATTIAAPVAAGATNMTTYGSTLAANDVVLVQTAAGSVTNLTIFSRSQTTNYNIFFDNPINPPTNGSAADLFYFRSNTAYTTIRSASSSATVYYIDSTNGLAAGGSVNFETPTAIVNDLISDVASNQCFVLPLRGSVRTAIAAGNSIYERLTNGALIAATISSSATNLHVLTTNGFLTNQIIAVENVNGDIQLKAIFRVSQTNLDLTAAVGVTLAANDTVNIAALRGTAGLPADRDAREIIISATNSLVDGDPIIVAASSVLPWREIVSLPAAAATTNIYALTVATGYGARLPVGSTIYQLGSTYTLAVATGGPSNYFATVTSTNGLTPGQVLELFSTGGGIHRNTYRRTERVVMNTLTANAPIALALAAGDEIFLLGSPQTTPCGATTVRLAQDGSFTAPPGRPARMVLNGTSACSLNSVVGRYGP